VLYLQRRTVCEGDVEEETLHHNHHEGLDEEGCIVASPNPIKDSADKNQFTTLLMYCALVRT
jgi:hypothetical protein